MGGHLNQRLTVPNARETERGRKKERSWCDIGAILGREASYTAGHEVCEVWEHLLLFEPGLVSTSTVAT